MKNKHWQVLIQDEFDNLYHIGFYSKPQESIHDVNKFLSKRGLHVDEIDTSTDQMKVEINEIEDIRIRFIEHLPLMVVTAKEYLHIINVPVTDKDDISTAGKLSEHMEKYDEETSLGEYPLCLWDYPLEELDYCIEEEISVVKVIFDEGPSRLFEIPAEEE